MNKNYILIIVIMLLIITIIFIINNNLKLEHMVPGSQYVSTNDEYMFSFDKLNKYACYVECAQNSDVGNECKYAITSSDLYDEYVDGTCKLYSTINNSKHSPTDTLMYVQDKNIPNLGFVKTANTGYTFNARPIATYDSIHKLACDFQCGLNKSCSSYTSNLDEGSSMAGTCTLYNESSTNNTTNAPGTHLYTRPTNGFFR